MSLYLKTVSFIFFFIIFLCSKIAFSDTFIYSGGCFWCTEADTEKLNGVHEVISGFTGGTTENPKYYHDQWGDHREAALVKYDPNLISLKELIKHVFNTIDYEDNKGQFCDRGHSYSPAIYFKNNKEKKLILSLQPKSSVIAIEIEKKFYPVREEHQDYYKKNTFSYNLYRYRCGRDKRLNELN